MSAFREPLRRVWTIFIPATIPRMRTRGIPIPTPTPRPTFMAADELLEDVWLEDPGTALPGIVVFELGPGLDVDVDVAVEDDRELAGDMKDEMLKYREVNPGVFTEEPGPT